jgi:hypothetical protein
VIAIEPTGEANTQPRQLREGDVTPDYVVLGFREDFPFRVEPDSLVVSVQYKDGGRAFREWTRDIDDRISVEVLENVDQGSLGTLQGDLWEKACTYVWNIS